MIDGEASNILSTGPYAKIIGKVYADTFVYQDNSPQLLSQLPEMPEYNFHTAQAKELNALFKKRNRLYINGSPGIGKTETLIQLAHEVKNDFSDGQIYFQANRESTAQSFIEYLVNSFSLGESISNSGEHQGIINALLNNKKILVLIDDVDEHFDFSAISIPQSCGLIVTSRHQISRGSSYKMSVFSEEECRKYISTCAPELKDNVTHIHEISSGFPIVINLMCNHYNSLKDGIDASRFIELYDRKSFKNEGLNKFDEILKINVKELTRKQENVLMILSSFRSNLPKVVSVASIQSITRLSDKLVDIDLDEAEIIIAHLAKRNLIVVKEDEVLVHSLIKESVYNSASKKMKITLNMALFTYIYLFVQEFNKNGDSYRGVSSFLATELFYLASSEIEFCADPMENKTLQLTAGAMFMMCCQEFVDNSKLLKISQLILENGRSEVVTKSFFSRLMSYFSRKPNQCEAAGNLITCLIKIDNENATVAWDYRDQQILGNKRLKHEDALGSSYLFARYYSSQGKTEKALEYYKKACGNEKLDESEHFFTYVGSISVHIEYAIALAQSGNYDTATGNLIELSASLVKNLNDVNMVCFTKVSLAFLYIFAINGADDEVITNKSKLNLKIVAWAVQNGSPRDEAFAFLILGMIYLNSDSTSIAIALLEHSMSVAKNIDYIEVVNDCKFFLASCHERNNEIDKAIDYLNQILKNAKDKKQDKWLVDKHKNNLQRLTG